MRNTTRNETLKKRRKKNIFSSRKMKNSRNKKKVFHTNKQITPKSLSE